jgi:spore maturation protein SpmB
VSEKHDDKRPFSQRLGAAAAKTLKPALATTRFLLTVMLPVSFVVLVLDSSGVLYHIAHAMHPLMRFLGLRGEASLAFISAVFLNIYSALAVIGTLHLSPRELVILATMCFIAHNFFVECLVMRKTGSFLPKMLFLRLFCAVAAAWLMHIILPASLDAVETTAIPVRAAAFEGFLAMLLAWLVDNGLLILRVVLIIFGVTFVHKALDEFGLMMTLGRLTAPVMKLLGLPPNVGYVWIAANVADVAYSAALLMEAVKAGTLSQSEADLFNHHAAISHSQLGDTLLFTGIGVPYLWAALPRFLLAVLVVWLERGRRELVRRSFSVKVE